jgi:hypothetical protein
VNSFSFFASRVRFLPGRSASNYRFTILQASLDAESNQFGTSAYRHREIADKIHMLRCIRSSDYVFGRLKISRMVLYPAQLGHCYLFRIFFWNLSTFRNSKYYKTTFRKLHLFPSSGEVGCVYFKSFIIQGDKC